MRSSLAAFAFGFGGLGLAATENAAGAETPADAAPVVVEMFLSQACKNCPPAAAYSAELARRPGVIALAWHIDYWNMLSNRKYGRWEDPYSRAVFADRQRQYNKNIRNRSTVFTPQAIINGEASIVGSKREQVESAIGEEKARAILANIEMSREGDAYEIAVIAEMMAPCEALLVYFHPTAITDVRAGDNAGLRFEEANVVADFVRLGAVSMESNRFTAPRPQAGMSCAVIVQEPDQGRILAARYCP